jgi:hypothetical protein
MSRVFSIVFLVAAALSSAAFSQSPAQGLLSALEAAGLVTVSPADRPYVVDHLADKDFQDLFVDWQSAHGEVLSPYARGSILAGVLETEAFYVRKNEFPSSRIRQASQKAIRTFLDEIAAGGDLHDPSSLLAEDLGQGALLLRPENHYGRLVTESALPNAVVYLGDELVGPSGVVYRTLTGTYAAKMLAGSTLVCTQSLTIVNSITTSFSC